MDGGGLTCSHYALPDCILMQDDFHLGGSSGAIARSAESETFTHTRNGNAGVSALGYLRGRCFSDIDRIINLPLPLVTKGGSA
jgi:hypothetical protein